MAVDPGTLDLMQNDLAALDVIEKRMFGGVAFMLDGNMLAGILGEAALYRVGKPGMAAALALPGVGPMQMGARTMGGYVSAGPDALADEDTRATLLSMARAFHATLPPK